MSGAGQPRGARRERPGRRRAPPALGGAAFAAALAPLLTPWLGAAGFAGWQRRVADLPLANRLFLELHLGQERRRCDIVSSITVSDGSLAAWAGRASGPHEPVWHEATSLLQAWQRQLALRQGALWADCLMMWFEFDLPPATLGLGAPSLFIALRPGANLARLTEAAAAFPALQAALGRFTAWRAQADPAFRQQALLLGHIGYMAARGEGAEVLPLRSCWRCDDAAHLRRLLQASTVPIDAGALAAAFAALGDLMALGNSLMLDLDSDAAVQPDFAVEINLFQRQEGLGRARMQAALRLLADLGAVTPAEAAAASALSGHGMATPGGAIICLPHHVKIRFKACRIDSVKLYWLARVMDHPPRPAADAPPAPILQDRRTLLLLTRNETGP